MRAMCRGAERGTTTDATAAGYGARAGRRILRRNAAACLARDRHWVVRSASGGSGGCGFVLEAPGLVRERLEAECVGGGERGVDELEGLLAVAGVVAS
jgi:hypothetical protein